MKRNHNVNQFYARFRTDRTWSRWKRLDRYLILAKTVTDIFCVNYSQYEEQAHRQHQRVWESCSRKITRNSGWR